MRHGIVFTVVICNSFEHAVFLSNYVPGKLSALELPTITPTHFILEFAFRLRKIVVYAKIEPARIDCLYGQRFTFNNAFMRADFSCEERLNRHLGIFAFTHPRVVFYHQARGFVLVAVWAKFKAGNCKGGESFELCKNRF